MAQDKKVLSWSDIYFNPANPGGFSGIKNLVAAKKGGTKKSARDFLKKTLAYTLHKQVIRKFERRRFFAKSLNDHWQTDLIDFSKFSPENDRFKFVLLVIDIFSKNLYSEPLKNKSATEVKNGFSNILKKAKKKPKFLSSDQGTEYTNKIFQNYLKSKKNNFFTNKNIAIKASIVERVIRTVKARLFRFFTHNNTRRWLEALPEIVHAYNHTIHKSHGLPPFKVTTKNARLVRDKLYPFRKRQANTLNVGDFVRVSKHKKKFEKSYLANWSEEIFSIAEIKDTNPFTYILADLKGQRLEGTFYLHEIQKVFLPEFYRLEKILKSRTKKGKKEYFVKWLGFPQEFSEWVNEKNIKKL